MDAEIANLLSEADAFLGDDGAGGGGDAALEGGESWADMEEDAPEDRDLACAPQEEAEEADWELVDEKMGVSSVDTSPASSAGGEQATEDEDAQLAADVAAQLADGDDGLEELEEEDEDEAREGRPRDGGLEREARPSVRSLASEMRIGLEEHPKDQDRFEHLVQVLGAEGARTAYEATLRQEAQGGLRTSSEHGGKRRSKGGAFFVILKEQFATEEQLRAINKFRKDKQKSGAKSKATREVFKGQGGRPSHVGGGNPKPSSNIRKRGRGQPGGKGLQQRRNNRPADGRSNRGGGGGGGGGGSGDSRRRKSAVRTPRPQLGLNGPLAAR